MGLVDHKEIEAMVLAGAAGLLGYCMRTIQSGKRLRFLQAIVETTSAGLAGYLVHHLCEAMKIDHPWSPIVIGIFGWMGASGSVVILQKFVLKRLGIREKRHGRGRRSSDE